VIAGIEFGVVGFITVCVVITVCYRRRKRNASKYFLTKKISQFLFLAVEDI